MAGTKVFEVHEKELKKIYPKKQTEYEIFLWRKQTGLKKKAKYHWALLRDSVRSVTKAVEEADRKELELTHGIYRERKLNHHQQISQVLYIPEHKEYLTCDGQNFYFFHENGQKKVVLPALENINRVVYSSQTSQFVGWTYGQENLYLMSRDLVIGSQSKVVGRIFMCVYNDKTGELITVGPHFITCWIFRYGARYLIPRKTTSTNFGESNMFSTMVLEDTASQTQRIFFAQENGVVIFNIFSGIQTAHKKDLHAQPVTALTYFNPLKYIITGAQDGCIKVWDADWKIKMVFVGHSDQVNFLKIYPYGPAFISASLDCTLRVWNIDSSDEMDKIVISKPIEGMDTHMNYDIFYTYTGKTVNLWKLQHLYYIHTYIGYQVNKIKMTNHPLFPQRALVLCQDSSVRVICPANGEVITTLLMKQTEDLIDAAYAVAQDTIFAVMSNGDIIKGMANQNPCDIVSRWKFSNPEEMCNCLLVYEYVVDPTASSDVWSLRKHTVKSSGGHLVRSQQNSKNRTLLLGGRKNGCICVFDWHTGEVTFKTEAHGNEGVLSMIANTRSDQLISAGSDNVIKVWRLYPFAQEALTPLMSFFCAHCPSFMTTIKNGLGVAFQDPSTATFSVVLYSLSDRSRCDHKPDDDHMDLITGLTSCPRMKLFASSSIDGTLCIWNENNTLLRLLHLNTAIHSIAFCSPRGDLLVGIDNHLFHIPHTKYLPKSYRRKQVCMKFLPIKTEQPLPYVDSRLNLMDTSDVKRLKNAHASFRYFATTDGLPYEEQEQTVRERNIKEEAFRHLELRENEIKQIRDGALRAQHKAKSTKLTQDTAFREYMKMFYNKVKEKISLDDEYPEDTLQKRVTEPHPVQEEKYYPEEEPYGFFSEMGKKILEEDSASLLHLCYPSASSGFLPNSVLIKILHPVAEPEEVPWEMTPYQPPELTSKQLEEIRSPYKRKGSGQDLENIDMMLSRTVTFADDERLFRVLEIDLTDDDEDKKKEKSNNSSFLSDKFVRRKPYSAVSRMTPNTQQLKRKKVHEDVDNDADVGDMVSQPEKLSSFLSKLQEILNKPSSGTEDIRDAPKPPPSPRVTKHPVPAKAVTKFISDSEFKPQASKSARSVTSPKPTTPLPNFIKQFVTAEWFHKHFPNCNENTMPRPWTSDTFVSMISKLLRTVPWIDKVNVIEAILQVYIQEGLTETVTLNVARTIVAVLNHHTSPAVCSVVEQKAFILSALKTLAALVVKEKDVIAEMMVQFFLGDRDVRSTVLDVMVNLGLVDPNRQLQKELDSWDIWSIDENSLRSELHNMCNQWLERWMISYKMRIKDSVHLLKQGHSLQGYIFSTETATGRSSRVYWLYLDSHAGTPSDFRGRINPVHIDKSSVKTYEKESVISSQDISKTSHHKFSVRNGQMAVSHDSLTVSLDRLELDSPVILESVNYLDAVTYFCEIVTEKELEALKRGDLLRGDLLRGKHTDRVVQAKNTVLVLPRISQKPALVRLGEMHTSQCRPERETNLHSDFRIPPITIRGRQPAPGDLSSFVSCINLPMKTVYLNPFVSASGEKDAFLNQPILITLKSSQKYFFPSQSYVSRKDHVALGS